MIVSTYESATTVSDSREKMGEGAYTEKPLLALLFFPRRLGNAGVVSDEISDFFLSTVELVIFLTFPSFLVIL